ncbi:MAG: hypothetical protein LBL18_02410 [Bacteroidales bacterium]|jgi:hypothetical protein|nr:hypothetical protein [Bacteroidales bacterium]
MGTRFFSQTKVAASAEMRLVVAFQKTSNRSLVDAKKLFHSKNYKEMEKNKKLRLNKMTVAELDNLDQIKGGAAAIKGDVAIKGGAVGPLDTMYTCGATNDILCNLVSRILGGNCNPKPDPKPCTCESCSCS